MKSTIILALLMLALASPLNAVVAPSTALQGQSPGAEAASPYTVSQQRAPDAAGPNAPVESVEPSERFSEPEGVFGFARLALGLVGAVIAGAIVFAWSLFARQRKSGKQSDSERLGR